MILGIRPEDLEDAAEADGDRARRRITAVVDIREDMGSEVFVHFGVRGPPVRGEDVKAAVGADAVEASEEEARKQGSLWVARLGRGMRARERDRIDLRWCQPGCTSSIPTRARDLRRVGLTARAGDRVPAVLDPKVFKAYDIRGIHPAELDEDGAYRIGRAYVEQFEPRKIAVGHDMRVSSPAMAGAFVRGASEAGADVLELGLVGTEMVYFAVGALELDGGAEITASHNPKEYTGIKIVRRGALPVGGESGLLDIRDRALSLGDTSGGQTPGQVEKHDVWPAYVDRVLSFVDVSAIKPLRVVIDAANGMAGVMLPPVLERLPIDAVPYYFEPDGTFPNHEPNPLLPENREFIIERTTSEGADFGVAFDGDADRCFFVDDRGEFVPGDFVTALFAESILEKQPGSKVIYDLRASWAVPETVEAAGGTPLVNRVGHAFIKQRMREDDAAFGGEVSGHYYFREFTQADSGVVPFLLMLELVSRRGQKLSEILRPFRERYFITGELNTPVPDVDAKLDALEERFGREGEVSHLDGISVDADDWHFNVRPSNTEPLLRLNLEARSEELMERKRDEVLDVIRG
ncbi:MAG TPA: phosphomannomutase CpsG [Gaiellaceae bacterium]